MVRLAFFPLAALAAVAAAADQTPLGGKSQLSGKWDWKSCGEDSDVVQVESINITPDPPQPGKDMTVTVKGTSSSVIEDGAYADVVVKLGLVKLLTKRFDICKEAADNNVTIQCPVEKGDHIITHTVTLPKEIPKAAFKVHIDGFMENDDDMLCVDLAIDFRNRPFFGF